MKISDLMKVKKKDLVVMIGDLNASLAEKVGVNIRLHGEVIDLKRRIESLENKSNREIATYEREIAELRERTTYETREFNKSMTTIKLAIDTVAAIKYPGASFVSNPHIDSVDVDEWFHTLAYIKSLVVGGGSSL